ncbi:hypothetical protein QJS10_CPB12g00068 [Acorus calamus]|uniref:NAD-dependent epimerase/dehydratase domain-containing protein n=1 Tax=Acorus calamus TaxID=4465 RepID=A0AAV9DJE1_ACOCL|nr:hypothetical protein QJS10_CPB12g00068 [Acorus calamus]
MEIQSVSAWSPIQPTRHVNRSLSLPIRATAAASLASPESGGSAARRMFVFGTGYVGRYVSDRLRKGGGWYVSGTCKDPVKKKELEEIGLDVFLFDANSNDELTSLNTLQSSSHLLISIPPVVDVGDPLLYRHEESLRSALSCGNLQWLCYLSSTSVYGDCGGAYVDENYPANPLSEFAKARLSAEKGWLKLTHSLGVPTYIFRLGGIYGPGRSALDTIIKQESLSKAQRIRESKQYTARIHVADIYQAIEASFNIQSSRKIYNIVDDDPAPRDEVFAFARALIEARWPGQLKEVSPGGVSDLTPVRKINGEKRVSNALMKSELGVSLLHPSYRSGLQCIADSWEDPFKGKM